MNVYIATGLENMEEHKQLRELLAKEGHLLTYNWTKHGPVKGQSEEVFAQVAEAEANGVLDANALIVILPGGRGTHAELGMALNCLPILVVGPADKLDRNGDPCVFYWHESVTRLVKTNLWLQDAVAWANQVAAYSTTP